MKSSDVHSPIFDQVENVHFIAFLMLIVDFPETFQINWKCEFLRPNTELLSFESFHEIFEFVNTHWDYVQDEVHIYCSGELFENFVFCATFLYSQSQFISSSE